MMPSLGCVALITRDRACFTSGGAEIPGVDMFIGVLEKHIVHGRETRFVCGILRF